MIKIKNKFEIGEKVYIWDTPGIVTKISIDQYNVVLYFICDKQDKYTWYYDYQLTKEEDYIRIGFTTSGE